MSIDFTLIAPLPYARGSMDDSMLESMDDAMLELVDDAMLELMDDDIMLIGLMDDAILGSMVCVAFWTT